MIRTVLGLLILSLFLLAGCFFGSTLNVSQDDVRGKPNLVVNGDMEEGLYGIYKREALPEHWMVLPHVDNATAWEETQGQAGSRCIRLQAGSTRFSLISDSFPITASAAYYNRLWLKTDHDNGEEVEVRFMVFDDAGNTLNQFTQRVEPATDWTLVEFSTSFFKKTARFGRIMLVIPPQAQRYIWVDGVGSYQAVTFSE